MPGTIRLGALLALLAAAVALPGCGSDEGSGEIPADKAPALTAALDGVSTTIETDCVQAQEHAQEFVDAVNNLPAEPTGDLKSELQEAGGHLRTLVEDKCAAAEEPGTTPDTTTPTTDTTPTDTTPTETTPTDTTPTETTPTDTTPTDQTPPPSDGNGDEPPSDGGDGGTGGTGGTGGPGSGTDE